MSRRRQEPRAESREPRGERPAGGRQGPTATMASAGHEGRNLCLRGGGAPGGVPGSGGGGRHSFRGRGGRQRAPSAAVPSSRGWGRDGGQRRPRVEKVVPSRRRVAGEGVRERPRRKAQLLGPRRPLRLRTGMRWVRPLGDRHCRVVVIVCVHVWVARGCCGPKILCIKSDCLK